MNNDNRIVIIRYDDSDGWYDHVMLPIVSQSNDPIYDRLLGKDGLCGHAHIAAYQDMCVMDLVFLCWSYRLMRK